MNTTDQSLEREIVGKGLTAPRVTPADIQAAIASERYFTAAEGVYGAEVRSNLDLPVDSIAFDGGAPLGLLTVCVLVLRNGFTCVGTSACASPENFDAEIGRKAAKAKALDDVWKVMGYALRGRLFEATSKEA